jgi:hypothetical protein
MSIWGSIAEAAGSAVGAFFGGGGGGSSQPQYSDKIRKRTDSSATMSDFDVLYNSQALEGIQDLTTKIGEWSDRDQDFLTNYGEYQQQVAEVNQSILPHLSATTKEGIKANAKDLIANTTLKDFLRQGAQSGVPGLQNANNRLQQHLQNIPSEDERIGQALASVEENFGTAGKELAREFAQRGQTVSQSSARDLAMRKAGEKTKQAGLAAEAARQEKTSALQAGLASEAQVAQTEAGIRGQDINSLAQLQESQQSTLSQPQLDVDAPTTGSTELLTGLATVQSQQQFGTRSKQDQISHVQKGIKKPVMTSGAGGAVEGGLEIEPALVKPAGGLSNQNPQ